MNRYVWSIGLIAFSLISVSCGHTPTQEATRAPQSVDSPQTLERTIALLGELMNGGQLSTDLVEFNKKAVILCWRNPAWEKIQFNDQQRKISAKRFLCNVPLQFRLCHTLKFLQIEGQFNSGKKNPRQKADRDAAQLAAFQQCDAENTRYLRTAYQWNGGSLNTLTNGNLFELYKMILLDRKTPLPDTIETALNDVKPLTLFKIPDSSHEQELDTKEAVLLALNGLQHGIEPKDIVNFIVAVGGSKIKELF